MSEPLSRPGLRRRPRRAWPSLFFAALAGLAGAPAQALDDPLRPPDFRAGNGGVAPLTLPGELRLGMIVHGPGRRAAVIGEHLLQVGDRIEGLEVVAIGRDHVRLARGERSLRLELPTARSDFKSNSRESDTP